MYKILILGDLHIGGIENVFPGRGVMMQVQQLRKQLDIAVLHKCTDVVFLGDVFDTSHPSQETISKLLEVLLDSKYVDLCLHMYPGNHDISMTTSVAGKSGIKTKMTHSLVLMQDMIEREWVNTTGCAEINLYSRPGQAAGKIPFYFLPYPHTKCDVNNVIVFLHNSFKGTLRDHGTIDNESAPWDAKLAQERGQLWVSGHLHTKQSQKRLHYIGVSGDNRSLPPREHYIGLIEWDGKSPLSDNMVEYIPYKPGWLLTQINVKTDAEVEQAEALLEVGFDDIRLKLVLHGYPINRLPKSLREDKRVRVLTNKDKFTKPTGDDDGGTKKIANLSNRDWILAKIPTNIKQSLHFRRVRKHIDIAESL